MQMPDVNILVYANRGEAPEHARYSAWLKKLATGPEPFALSESVMHAFVRISTDSRIFGSPSSVREAFTFLDALIERPGCAVLRPGPGHRAIFQKLCLKPGVRGKLVSDAAHAALAIEYGCEWVTADTDFGRFAPELRWRHL